MHIRQSLSALFAALIIAFAAGCDRIEPSVAVPPSVPSADTVARVHWLGKKRLGVAASAYYFMRIWGLPESSKLESQTLDKLALAPWRILRGEGAVAGAPTALLRPLLNDIVWAECFFEFRQATNQSIEWAFAIRLDEQRAGLWRTNLAAVTASLTGVATMNLQDGGRSWSLKRAEAPNLIESRRIRDWMVLGVGQDKNALLDELAKRIQRNHAPSGFRETNSWLEADLDLQRLAGTLAHSWNLPVEFPRISLNVTGDGGNVLTRGELNFKNAFSIEFTPWNIPTNLIREPLTGFTAIRGFRPWLESWSVWRNLQIGKAPNQLYFWSNAGVPMQSFWASPLPDVGEQVRLLTEVLLRDGNAWLATNSVGSFARLPDANGAVWSGLPLVSPWVKASDAAQPGFALGALLPAEVMATNLPPSPGMIQDVLRRTNLVYYDWEMTGPRIESWLYLSQIIRITLRHAQVPADSTAITWLRTVSARVNNTATVVTSTGPNEFSFVRKSTLGLAAPELHLLADWLESPQFPHGLFSSVTVGRASHPPVTLPVR